MRPYAYNATAVRESPDFMDNLLAGDEPRTFEYDPEIKRQHADGLEKGTHKQVEAEEHPHLLFRFKRSDPRGTCATVMHRAIQHSAW